MFCNSTSFEIFIKVWFSLKRFLYFLLWHKKMLAISIILFFKREYLFCLHSELLVKSLLLVFTRFRRNQGYVLSVQLNRIWDVDDTFCIVSRDETSLWNCWLLLFKKEFHTFWYLCKIFILCFNLQNMRNTYGYIKSN